MPNSLTEHERKRLISRLRLQRALRQRGADAHPQIFRSLVRVSANEPTEFHGIIQPWQTRDFAALDPAWLALSGRYHNPGLTSEMPGFHAPPPEQVREARREDVPGFPIVRRAFLERPRGHSKTTDTAVQVAWILQYARASVTGLAAAADRDQAGLLRRAVAELVRLNPDLCPHLETRESAIINPATGSRLDVISSDVRSSWGQLPDFVICDELCHWEKPDLWHSLLSSAAKKPMCVLIVLTNAGVGQGWQWTVREAARTSPDWHFSTIAGPQAPWISTAALAEQRRLLPPAVYARLWENAWQQTDGEFVTLPEAEACRDNSLTRSERGRHGRSYVAAIDYAEKHDRTVGVVVHQDGERILVDRMDVVAPKPEQPVPVQWVEDWIVRMAAAFPVIRFVLDEYQLVGTLQKFAGRFDLKRFEFAGGKGNHALALHLRHLIVQRRLAWYPGCGQIAESNHRDDLETELASLILRTSSAGRVRIDHRRETNCHDDRSFALGVACLELLHAAPIGELYEVQENGFGW